MFIKSALIRNYKCFRETPTIELLPGFNVVVGRNDSGKTSLVEALSLQFGLHPHRSDRSIPAKGAQGPNTSEVEVVFAVPPDEFHSLACTHLHGYSVGLPSPEPNNSSLAFTQFEAAIADGLELHVTYSRSVNQNAPQAQDAYIERFRSAGNSALLVTQLSPKPGNIAAYLTGHSAPGSMLPHVLSETLRSGVFMFRAERLVLPELPVSHETELKPDASNLAPMLARLHENRSRFDRMVSLFRSVFPDVTGVSTRLAPHASILVWKHDPGSERDDLAVRLEESGSGLGQVLAILYLLVTAERPRVIIIDEPQSFLHPGAARRLLAVLRQYPKHQYILTTHSPGVIVGASRLTALYRVRNEAGTSICERMSGDPLSDARTLLADVGARLSDVFGADGILWAEGPTEEVCFPIVVGDRVPPSGQVILGVSHTADFDKRRAEIAVDVYERLSVGNALIPPAIAFVLDRELRSEQEVEDLGRRLGGKVTFLPRRMYECYLLNEDAIAAVLSAADSLEGAAVKAPAIRDWLTSHSTRQKYWPPRMQPAAVGSVEFKRHIHGAELLGDLFSDLSSARVRYDKVRHGEALTRWIVQHAQKDLQEICDLLVQRLTSQTSQAPSPASGVA